MSMNWIKETFGLVEAPAASAKKKPSEEMTIDEKVSSYRAELEAEEAIRTLEASPTGSAGGAKEA